ncbi:MAG TPA: response regulator [Polyangia bacterium]|nr:response regulator [Polyangia bacterium]
MVDDSEDDAEIVLGELRLNGWRIEHERVCDGEALRAALARQTWDLVLSDWSMPAFSGRAALDVLNDTGIEVPFIIVSGTVTEELAIDAMRSGARDWVLKDKLGRLPPAIKRELTEIAERRRAAEALKRSEERLRQSQKMDAIGGLAAGVAHDFNNVLSVIIGHADLLLGHLEEAGEDRESVEEIRAAASRAAELTRQLLAFSRQQVLRPQRTDLGRVVVGMAKMLRRLIGEDIELAISVLPAVPPSLGAVTVDPGQIEQVVMNLAVNARDAMPRGGSLTIEAKDLDIDELTARELQLKAGAYVALVVTDTGTGMDAATEARIFEPFFTTKEVGSGTGLGLATVFGIVQQSGGTIATKTALGHGTTFTLYFPRASGSARGEEAPADPWRPQKAVPRGRETILLVEDDAAVRGTLRTVLQRFGYRVVEASNGVDGLRAFEAEMSDGAADRSTGVDLVLTDVVMPHMSGKELVSKLEVLNPDISVLYMSGYNDGAVLNHGVVDSGVAFIQKPVSPNELVERIRDILERKQRTARKPEATT